VLGVRPGIATAIHTTDMGMDTIQATGTGNFNHFEVLQVHRFGLGERRQLRSDAPIQQLCSVSFEKSNYLFACVNVSARLAYDSFR